MASPSAVPNRSPPARSAGSARRGSRAPGPARRSVPNLALVEVDLPTDPTDHWLRDITERWRLRARLDLCRPLAGRGSRMLQLVELSGSAEDLDSVERYLRRRAGTSEFTMISVSPTRRFVRAVSETPDGCRRAFDAGAACLTCQLFAPDGPGGASRWTLVLPGTRRALRLVGQGLPRAPGRSTRLLGMRRFAPRRTPTPRQAMAIEAAYRLGYYAFPRRIGLGELARVLAVSRSTASELLRRAEGALLARELDAASG